MILSLILSMDLWMAMGNSNNSLFKVDGNMLSGLSGILFNPWAL